MTPVGGPRYVVVGTKFGYVVRDNVAKQAVGGTYSDEVAAQADADRWNELGEGA